MDVGKRERKRNQGVYIFLYTYKYYVDTSSLLLFIWLGLGADVEGSNLLTIFSRKTIFLAGRANRGQRVEYSTAQLYANEC